MICLNGGRGIFLIQTFVLLKCQIHTIRSHFQLMGFDYDGKFLIWGNIFLRNSI